MQDFYHQQYPESSASLRASGLAGVTHGSLRNEACGFAHVSEQKGLACLGCGLMSARGSEQPSAQRCSEGTLRVSCGKGLPGLLFQTAQYDGPSPNMGSCFVHFVGPGRD